MLHGDFNPGNILSASRAPWLAIDPKPMIGDPAYDPEPLLDQLGDPLVGDDAGDALRVLRERYRHYADVVGVPADRMLAWGVARSVESALWSASVGRIADGEQDMRTARVLARAGDL